MMKIALTCGLCLGLFACADVPARSPSVAVVDGDAHVTVRAEGGRLWWSHRPWSEPHALWALPNQGAVESLRVTAVASATDDDVFNVSFVQGGVRYHGTFGFDPSTSIETPRAFLAQEDDVGTVAMEDTLARGGR